MKKFAEADVIEIAPEMYELKEIPPDSEQMGVSAASAERRAVPDFTRRDFFKILGAGLMTVFVEPLFAQESGRRGRGSGNVPNDISAWLHIAEDGTITVYSGKAEVGQNVRTSCAQAVAEELRAPISSIKVLLADTDLVPYDAGTFGSQSTPQMHSRLHRVGAAAREALLDLAAEYFKVDRASLTVAGGKITKAGGSESATFGQLTKGQKLVRQVDNNAPVTPASEWKVCGTSVAKLEGRDFVTGKHKYASDVKLPGMVFGKVLRPASYEATSTTIDTKPAEAIDGVKVVRDGDFIGVVANDSLTANHAIHAIRAEGNSKPQPSSAEIFDYLKKNSSGPAGQSAAMEEALGKAAQKIEATYTVAYIAHTPLEPRAAVAEWKDGKVTIWTGTQRPFGVKSDVAWALGVAEDKVRVIVPDTGSGYGGKHSGECAIEAARLARAAGKPVKLVWTREEEFTWAYFRPAGVIDITAAVDADGRLTVWDFHNYNSGGSAVRSPYDVPGQRSEFHGSKSPLKQGSYRGLAATANHFARESAMDELASAAKVDPLEFRLKNLKDARLKAVLEAAAEKFGWGKQKSSETHGFGLAGGTEKGSYVATCAEVAIDRSTGGVRVVRAVTAFECGAVVNPDHLTNQIEGAVVMGLGGALFEAIEFKDGKITNGRLADYRVPRFTDTPKLETVLVNRKDLPSAGAGETPIVAIAPAVGNAIFAATNMRVRSLPMVPDGLKLKT
jgi:nicotinate dehydrogenase subunit B